MPETPDISAVSQRSAGAPVDPAKVGQPDQKPNELKTIVGAVAIVLAVGLLILGGLVFSLHRGDSSGAACGGKRQVGFVSGLLDDAKSSPTNGTLGGRCEYYVLLRDGKLRAAKAHIAGASCALDWYEPHKAFRCDKVDVAWSKIEYWPTREITTGPQKGEFEIDFG